MNERTSPVTGITPTPRESELADLLSREVLHGASNRELRMLVEEAVYASPLFRAANEAVLKQMAYNRVSFEQAGQPYTPDHHATAAAYATSLEQQLVRCVLRDAPLLLTETARGAHVMRLFERVSDPATPSAYSAWHLLKLPSDYLDGAEL